ncbi:aminotransferase class V-fold PLP-dependent enzyme [Draconibacterium sp. IB214405]|uniref:aminotransferase class V-fold PLP-dependent enzyme n=1 Tax=Draconibacterium sp. IB214405 TaxID=3097352 RepID=UPI002A0D335D|nr:aminotransferase class V-fold PLP-dependent enzyme [Draconibacterium sp. IB214405]MDX8338676.1 aminotransferase class V-fold PLP-dependent enzyme [Draconibacterium sp. IB214405]
MSLERYFNQFRKNIVGIDQEFETPYGTMKINYGDWIASGRLYRPIECKITDEIGPYVGNTHTETSETGMRMTHAYHKSHQLIKQHVNAGSNDIIITAGFGMTAVINKFQRILGLKYCGKVAGKTCIAEREKPVVFLTHMEHHSNQTSWYETSADVVVIEPGEGLLVDPENLRKALEKYKDRPFKIGSFTACSNVTGVRTPYHEMAKIMHEYGGVCFIDFAASAPYDEINMHPEDPMEKLDAVMFSPHKFLGGPGSSGVIVFDVSMYKNTVPDNPGGGTVDWTNPWGKYKYVDDIEAREDGGTPGFLQSIRTALCFDLKDQMGIENIRKREEELLERAFAGLDKIDGLNILADNVRDRLGVISFYVEGIHYNLLVRLLNDMYGIQTRGGCACAGTYGHFLLEVSLEQSEAITSKINLGDLSDKPGWVRWSLHPTATDEEVDNVIAALKDIVSNIETYKKDYVYVNRTNTFWHKDEKENQELLKKWFTLEHNK